MTPDGAPVPHQALHGSAKKIRRYYVVCACGYRRGRNARFPCACGAPPASWSAAEARAYWAAKRKHIQWLAKQGYCYCESCRGIRYALARCSCGSPAIAEEQLRQLKRISAKQLKRLKC